MFLPVKVLKPDDGRPRQVIAIAATLAFCAAAAWGGWVAFRAALDQETPPDVVAADAARTISRCAISSRIKVEYVAAAYETPAVEMLRVPWDDELWSFDQLADINCGLR